MKLKEIPKGTRNESPVWKMFFYYPYMSDPTTQAMNIKRLTQLDEIAKELKCSLAQLAIAWTLKNKDVTKLWLVQHLLSN